MTAQFDRPSSYVLFPDLYGSYSLVGCSIAIVFAGSTTSITSKFLGAYFLCVLGNDIILFLQ
jgi:hypothetical protein